MTLKVICKARFAADEAHQNAGGSDEIDGQPERRECGNAVESMKPAEAVRHRQCEALGIAREPGGSSESFSPWP